MQPLFARLGVRSSGLCRRDDPEEQAEAWERAVDTAPKDDDGKPKITAKHVQSVVDDMLGDEGSHTWTIEQKRAFVIGTAFKRRNLSPDQKKQLGREQKKLCKALRQQDVKQWTQSKLASMLGVKQNTISGWLKEDKAKAADHNITDDNANPTIVDTEATDSDTSVATSEPESPPDARVTIPATEHDKIFNRFQRHTEKDGWTAEKARNQIAADYDVSTSTIKRIITKKRKQRAAIANEQASVAESPVESFIYHGDFRKVQDIAAWLPIGD